MDPSEARDFNSRRRRDEQKRRRVEAAIEGLIRRDALPPHTAQAMSEGIYRLYRNLVAQKSFDDQDRHYREWNHCARDLAEGTANAPDTEISAYVANMREFAAHMIRLETLERRNLGRTRQSSKRAKPPGTNSHPKKGARHGYISRAMSFLAATLDSRRERWSF
jgi:hypothetical protein